MSSDQPVVGVVMGSDSDLEVMEPAADVLERFEVPFELRVVSAHRRPHEMLEYGRSAVERGLKVIIAGAGGAAHLPGMLASTTEVPVIGVPVPLRYLDGMDSLLSIVQMPRGVPVATVSVAGGQNAGLLAVRILATADERLRAGLAEHREEIAEQSRDADHRLSGRTERGVGFRPR
jgi:5-(carboxyamino)imidazole ribonucleotide mutase